MHVAERPVWLRTKPQVQKADPSDLGINLSYRGARQRGWSVIRFSGNSDGDRRSTARNGCATRSEEGLRCPPAAGRLACRAEARRYLDSNPAGRHVATWPSHFIDMEQ
jgi:hypothetical protein